MQRILMLLIPCLLPFLLPASSAATVDDRDFYHELSSSEKKDLSYLIHTLAEKSLPALFFCRSNLEKAGNRLDHLHPLRFISAIYTDPKLLTAVRTVSKRSMVWPEWVSGMAESFVSAHKGDNMHVDIQIAFCEELGIAYETLQPYFSKQDWIGLMNTVNRSARIQSKKA